MPQLAEPVLASQVWTAWQQKEDDQAIRPALFTACASFDDALLTSLTCQDYGLCCVSGDETVVTDISQALLISFLVSSASTHVAIIDARGSLDLLKLYTTIKSRLVGQHRSRPLDGSENLDEIATAMLDRIKIMRVFDYEGAIEAIHEIRSEIESPPSATLEASKPGLPRSTIPDSQADIDGEPLLPSSRDIDSMPRDVSAQPMETSEPQTLLVIDNLPSLITPIHRKSYTHSQALLSDLLRSLRHLHTVHGTTTILQNTTVGLSNRRPPNQQSDLDSRAAEVSPSIFASAKLKPALGAVLSENVDLHMMVHPVPRSSQDARAQIANEGRTPSRYDNERSEVGSRGRVALVNVVEVLLDRCGGRTGRFAAFEVGVDGVLKDAFR